MPLLKRDETVISRGFASTCKTKCVDLEGDELYKYCLTHCKRPAGWIEKKQTSQDPLEWERKTMDNVRKNEELQMQNFCYCDYKPTVPGQIVVPFTACDKNYFHHGEITFDRNFRARYKVDDIVIKEDGKLCNIQITNELVSRLHGFPQGPNKKDLRRMIDFATASFSNPIRIGLIVYILEQKITITAVLRSRHNIEFVETRLSEIKKG